MVVEQLRQLLRASAFRPFTVYADDKPLRIPHPEFAALTPSGKTLFVFHQNDDAYDLVDVALIARAEVQEPQGAGGL